MNVRSFPDTDAALSDFTYSLGTETREIGENVYVDIDADGNLVSITLGHAKGRGAFEEFTYREICR